LLGGKKCAQRVAIYQIAGGDALCARRPAQWEAERLAAADDPLFSYLWSLDRGDIEAAGTSIEQAFARRTSYGTGNRAVILMERAYFLARFGGDLVSARVWLDQGKHQAPKNWVRHRAEAAVLMAEGRLEEAAAQVNQGFLAIENPSHPGQARSERDWLHAILDDIKARRMPATVAEAPPALGGRLATTLETLPRLEP
jgi:hypothetical protein